jgi:tetrapyrrole methylase family protein/MazG family protein
MAFLNQFKVPRMTDNAKVEAISSLLEVMATLRAPNGCQWDREQTPQSLKPYILEEAYELLEAIDQGNPREICDELGDLLLQVVFQAQIFSESGDFTIMDVANAISTKLKRRHPHIFALANHEGHQQRWEKIKLQERSERGQSNKVADRIPITLPALKRAGKLLKKMTNNEYYATVPKVISQLESLRKLPNGAESNRIELEDVFGQLLLSVTFLAQSMEIDAEDSLRLLTNKMIEEIDKSKELL